MRSKKLLLAILLVVAVAAGAFTAAQASASSEPIVIPYAKTCDLTVGHCVGTAGNGGRIEMQVTSFRATGDAAQLTLTEWITVGGISFTAEMNGHQSPAGFIVLNGTVTEGLVRGRAHPPAKRLRRRRPDRVDVGRRAPAPAGECVSPITEAGRGRSGSRPAAARVHARLAAPR